MSFLNTETGVVPAFRTIRKTAARGGYTGLYGEESKEQSPTDAIPFPH
jgi:hypothetical protein